MREEPIKVKVIILPPEKSEDDTIRFMRVAEAFEDLGNGNFRKKPHLEKDGWQSIIPQDNGETNA